MRSLATAGADTRAQEGQRGWLQGFRRSEHNPELVALAENMGTVFSKGDGSHLQTVLPARAHAFVADTQCDNLRPELLVEVLEHEDWPWQSDPELGLVKVEAPLEGRMVRVKVTGQAVVYIGVGGKLVVDPRGY